MVSLQESQTQLQHTQAALTEQHEKTLRLSQKVVALRRFQRSRQHHHDGGKDTTSPAFVHDSLLQMEMDVAEAHNEEKPEEDSQNETLSKSKLFSYQTPGLEILQCKYRVAVTEVVELKAELKVLHDKLAQCVEGGGDGGGGGGEAEGKREGEGKPRPKDHRQQLEKQVVSLEKSTREEREKVATRPSVLIRFISILPLTCFLQNIHLAKKVYAHTFIKKKDIYAVSNTVQMFQHKEFADVVGAL